MPERKLKAAKAAFSSSIDCGITFFDTAEVYGSRVRWISVLVVSLSQDLEKREDFSY